MAIDIEALDKTAAERAGSLQRPTSTPTIQSLHERLTAVENHPALSVPAIVESASEPEQSNG